MEVVSFLFCYMNASTDLICTASHRLWQEYCPSSQSRASWESGKRGLLGQGSVPNMRSPALGREDRAVFPVPPSEMAQDGRLAPEQKGTGVISSR